VPCFSRELWITLPNVSVSNNWKFATCFLFEIYFVGLWDPDLIHVGTNKIHSLFQLFYPSIFHPSDIYLGTQLRNIKSKPHFIMEMMCHPPSKQRPPAKFFSASTYHFHRVSNAGVYRRRDGAGRHHTSCRRDTRTSQPASSSQAPPDYSSYWVHILRTRRIDACRRQQRLVK
jgi:hypothetical protein